MKIIISLYFVVFTSFVFAADENPFRRYLGAYDVISKQCYGYYGRVKDCDAIGGIMSPAPMMWWEMGGSSPETVIITEDQAQIDMPTAWNSYDLEPKTWQYPDLTVTQTVSEGPNNAAILDTENDDRTGNDHYYRFEKMQMEVDQKTGSTTLTFSTFRVSSLFNDAKGPLEMQFLLKKKDN